MPIDHWTLPSVQSGGTAPAVRRLTRRTLLVDDRLPEANAVKNMLVGAGALAAATIFVLAGPVDWRAVAPLAVGLFAGSTVGPVIARRVPPTVVRWIVAALGIALAIELWTGPN